MELVIKNLSKTYPNGVAALKNVSLTIPRGMFGLLGPNGAGKSSLMRTLATLQEADSGEVHLDSLDVLREKAEVRKILGYLPQEFGLYPKVTAEVLLDHIAALKGITSRGERKEVVAALLQKVNLWQARTKNLGTYSGGMKQRFGIAQALLGNPRLIIVDEPTAGLDPEERNRFLNLLAEIGEQVVIILSTHIVEDVADLCTNMAIIAGGKLLREGQPLAAIEQVRGQTWKKLIERDQLEAHSSSHHVISSRLFAGRVLIHVFSETRPDHSFEPVEPDLEDVYFTTLARARGQVAA
jgi:ABC-2 type transport system ATP-binding protein